MPRSAAAWPTFAKSRAIGENRVHVGACVEDLLSSLRAYDAVPLELSVTRVLASAVAHDGTVKADVMPPSSGKAAPVMKPASSLARYATVPASSSSVPKRPIG